MYRIKVELTSLRYNFSKKTKLQPKIINSINSIFSNYALTFFYKKNYFYHVIKFYKGIGISYVAYGKLN